MINNPSLNNKPIKIERALISVFDKTNITQLAQNLSKKGIKKKKLSAPTKTQTHHSR